jgi:histidyl-tRNA synthetase
MYDDLKPYLPRITKVEKTNDVEEINEVCTSISSHSLIDRTCIIMVTRKNSDKYSGIMYEYIFEDQPSTDVSGTSGVAYWHEEYIYRDGSTCKQIYTVAHGSYDKQCNDGWYQHKMWSEDNAGNISNTLTVNLIWK